MNKMKEMFTRVTKISFRSYSLTYTQEKKENIHLKFVIKREEREKSIEILLVHFSFSSISSHRECI